MIDVLVVGAGPVGLTVALRAARAGFDVVVTDPRIGVIDKACGEGLMPGALRSLAALGVDPPGHPFTGIRYTDGHRSVDARFAAPGRGVRRVELSQALALAAERAGVRRADARVTDIEQDAGSVTAAGMTARFLVAADGLHSPVAASLGLRAATGKPRRWGLRRHFRLAPWTEFVEVHIGADAEAYVTPVGPDTVGVAVLSAARRPFAEHLRRFPALADRLHHAAPASEVRGAGPLFHRTHRRVAGRVLLAGDAAGYVDALTGEGLAVGLAGASALVQALTEGRPERYEAAWRRASRRYRWITSSLLWAATHPTRRTIVPAAAALPPLYRAVVRQLAG